MADYAVFAALTALVVLADLGDVAVASYWLGELAGSGLGTHLGPLLFPPSAFLGCLAFGVVFVCVGRFVFVAVARAFSSSSRAVTWQLCRYLAYAVSEQEGWRRVGDDGVLTWGH